jgi:3-oxoacyl-[acyl-carrier protein] reductase
MLKGDDLAGGSMDLGIEGRCAAVAGASAGLGLGVAKALAAEGVRVAMCGRDADRIEAAARRVGSLATPIVADVSSAEGADAFAGRALELFDGRVDILLANGGGPPPGRAVDLDPALVREWVDRTLFAYMALCRALLPGMRERSWGRILAVTTVGVKEPLPAMVYSNIARTGITAYLKQLSREVIADGVTVNTLLPNSHLTERLEALIPDVDAYRASLPSGRTGTADDFGRVAAFLCSEHAGYLTGVALPIDGGQGTTLF